MTWLLDCDGVVWLADEAIPGSPEAVTRLRSAGRRVVMLTNNSFPLRAEYLHKLERLGMPTAPADLLSSAMAAASLLEKGERALVLGGPGLVEALEARGVMAVRAGHDPTTGGFDAVVVGLDPSFDYRSLTAAATAIQRGARFVASNDDATFPTPSGMMPGAGSLVAAVACASQTTPTVAGKPHEATVGLVAEHVGEVDIVVGDRCSTDGLLARRLGTRFGLVLTGVTPPDHGPLEPEPDLEAADLASLVASEIG